MLKNRIQYLILLLLIVGLYIFTNQYIIFILLAFFLIVPLLSFVLLVLSHRSITVDYEIPAVIKKAAAINFTLNNPSFFPVSGAVLNILCRNNLTGKEIKIQTFYAIKNRKATCVSLTISDISAGMITVIINRIKVCDILGLFSLSKKVFCEKSGLIYPDIFNIEIGMKKQNEISWDGEQYSQTQKGQDVNEIFALREYIPGDEIRKIHWKLSAKQNKLIVRDFGLSLNYHVFLLLEIFNKKENPDEVLEACMMTFVSVSSSLIKNGICHNIAWYDSVNENLVVKEIASVDELEAYLPELLSIQCYNKDAIALKYYEASSYCNMGLALYYITTEVNSEKIAERSLYQTVKTIYVTKENDDNVNNLYITTVTPQNIRSDIQSITI